MSTYIHVVYLIRILKTLLFNIVETRFSKVLKFDVWVLLGSMMMFRWLIKQPGIQKFGKACSHYQDMNDYHQSINRRTDGLF